MLAGRAPELIRSQVKLYTQGRKAQSLALRQAGQGRSGLGSHDAGGSSAAAKAVPGKPLQLAASFAVLRSR